MKTTVKNEIDQIELVYKGHGIPKDTLARWLSDVDGYIAKEILLIGENLPEYSYENAPGAELLVSEAPWRRMYFLYLSAMIDFVLKQYNVYANEIGEYNKVIAEYRHYIVTRYNPANTAKAQVQGYYISPYGLACKYGYEGTEEEWVAAVEAARVSAEGYASSAGESAEVAQNARNAAQAARSDAYTALALSRERADAAVLSAAHAQNAMEEAQSARDDTNSARDEAQSERESAQYASAVAQSAKEDAKLSMTGAQEARDAAQSALTDAKAEAENASAFADEAEAFRDESRALCEDIEEKLDNSLANALKGHKTGAVVVADDVSPIKHKLKIKCSSASDMTGAKVYCAGKNILDYTKATDREDNPLTIIEDGVLWDKLVNYYFLIPCFIPAGVGFAVSCFSDYSENPDTLQKFVQMKFEDGTVTGATNSDGYWFIPKENITHIGFRKTNTKRVETTPIKITHIQVELLDTSLKDATIVTDGEKEKLYVLRSTGKTPTEYERYVEVVSADIGADGIVEEIASHNPYMSLYTDASNNIKLDVTYERDINAALGAVDKSAERTKFPIESAEGIYFPI